MTNIGWDMIGTKGGKAPQFTVAGRLYARPAITHNLPYGHFAVSDNALDYDTLQERLGALSELVIAHYEPVEEETIEEVQNLEDDTDDETP